MQYATSYSNCLFIGTLSCSTDRDKSPSRSRSLEESVWLIAVCLLKYEVISGLRKTESVETGITRWVVWCFVCFSGPFPIVVAGS